MLLSLLLLPLALGYRHRHGHRAEAAADIPVSMSEVVQATLDHQAINFENGQRVSLEPSEHVKVPDTPRPNCTACLLREEARYLRIEQIKRDILKKLGFTSPPRVNKTDLSNSPIRAVIQQVAHTPMQRDQAPRSSRHSRAQTERMYVFATPPSSPLEDGSAVYVNLSSDVSSLHVDHAKLHIFVRAPTHAAPRPVVVQLRLYQILEITPSGSVKKELFAKRDFKTSIENGHWESLDVTALARLFARKRSRNLGFSVSAICNGENLVVLPKHIRNEDDHNMYMELDVSEGERRRYAREANQEPVDCATESESRCCRHELIINFEEWGWEFILAPKFYTAFHCAGECPRRYLQRYVHTDLASRSGVGGPCCFATEMYAIQMMYKTEHDDVVIKIVPDMQVARCGCA